MTSPFRSRFIEAIPRFGKIAVLFALFALLSPMEARAVETTPPLSAREIIERLTKVETKIDANTAAIAQLWQDMNAQFDRLSQLILGILGAFTALVAVTIGFALWDRRTMVRPFESKVKVMEDELARDRESLHSLLEAFRSLGKSDERVADVLRQFRLL